MEFMNYIHLIKKAEEKAKSEDRQVDAQDLFFMDYLLQIAEKDKKLERTELAIIEDLVKMYVDKYNESVDSEHLYFEID